MVELFCFYRAPRGIWFSYVTHYAPPHHHRTAPQPKTHFLFCFVLGGGVIPNATVGDKTNGFGPGAIPVPFSNSVRFSGSLGSSAVRLQSWGALRLLARFRFRSLVLAHLTGFGSAASEHRL